MASSISLIASLLAMEILEPRCFVYSPTEDASFMEEVDSTALSVDSTLLKGAIPAIFDPFSGFSGVGVVGAGRGDSAPAAFISSRVSSFELGGTVSALEETLAAAVSGAAAEVESVDPDGGGIPEGAELSSFERFGSFDMECVEAGAVAELAVALGFVFALLAFSAASNPTWRIATANGVSVPPVGGFEVDSVDECCLVVSAEAFDVVAEVEADEFWVGGCLDGVLTADVEGVAADGRGAAEANCS